MITAQTDALSRLKPRADFSVRIVGCALKVVGPAVQTLTLAVNGAQALSIRGGCGPRRRPMSARANSGARDMP